MAGGDAGGPVAWPQGLQPGPARVERWAAGAQLDGQGVTLGDDVFGLAAIRSVEQVRAASTAGTRKCWRTGEGSEKLVEACHHTTSAIVSLTASVRDRVVLGPHSQSG